MELPKDWQAQLQRVYPRRAGGQGWVKTGEQIKRHLKNGADWNEMLVGADNYRKHCAKTDEFVRMAQTFFGPNQWWTEFQEAEEAENTYTLDDQAAEYGLVRQSGENDEGLKARIGTAITKKRYGIA